MIRQFLQRSELLVYRFDAATPALPVLGTGFRYATLDRDAIDRLFGMRGEDQSRQSSYRRLHARGCIGMAITHGDEWASVGWVSHPTSLPPPHLNRRIIGPDALWTFYVHTRKEFRGMGLQKAGLVLRIQFARKVVGDISATVYTDVATDGIASRRAMLRVGFEPAGRLFVSKLRVPRVAEASIARWDRDAGHPPLVLDDSESSRHA